MSRWPRIGKPHRIQREKPFFCCLLIILFLFQTVIPPALASPVRNRDAGHLPMANAGEFLNILQLNAFSKTVQAQNNKYRDPLFVHHYPDPVNLRNGNLFLAYQDILIPYYDLPLEISRSYNSLSPKRGYFGMGWNSSLDVNLRTSPDKSRLIINEWSGAESIYSLIKAAGSSKTPEYIASPSRDHTVTWNTDGTFIRIRGNQLSETFSADGRLLQRTDAYGNRVQYAYDSQKQIQTISDNTGRTLTVTLLPSGLISSISDPIGRRCTYQYNSQNDLVAFMDFGGEKTLFTYDANHRLEKITQADGNTIRNAYEPKTGRILQQMGPGNKSSRYQYQFPGTKDLSQRTIVTDARGNRTQYEYRVNKDNQVTQLTTIDALGGRTVNTYDQMGNLTRRTDAEGSAITYRYDERGRVSSLTDQVGANWHYEYQACNSCDQKTKIINPLGDTTRIEYDEFGAIRQIEDPLNRIIRFKYDPFGNLIERAQQENKGVRFEYDPYGNLTATRTPMGVTTLYDRDLIGRITRMKNQQGVWHDLKYDDRDQVVSITDNGGWQIHITYDALKRPLVIADADTSFEYTYDDAGNLSQMKIPGDRIFRFRYDILNNLTEMIDTMNRSIQFQHDALSRPATIVDRNGKAYQLIYDGNGNPVEAVDPLGAKVTFRYGGGGRLVSYTDAAGNTATFNYDDLGRRTGVITPSGNETQYAYDAAGQLTEAINALGQKMAYRYDDMGNLIEQIDANGAVTAFGYDLDRRITRETDPLGRKTELIYNSQGLVEEVVKPDSHRIRNEYDMMGRLTRIRPEVGQEIELKYDKKGRPVSGRSGEFDFSYQYDSEGRLVEVEDIKRSRRIEYTWDASGQKIRTLVLPDNIWTTYSYDAQSNLTRMETSSGNVFRFFYDDTGRRDRIEYPNKTIADYQYSDEGLLESLSFKDEGGNIIKKADYRYDSEGFIQTMVDESKRQHQYGYDEMGRLSQAKNPENSTETFTYDGMGNLKTVKRATQTIEMTYNSSGELLSRGEDSYTYDPNGNRTEQRNGEGTQRYSYDDFNRLIEIELPNGETKKFSYDLSGNRIVEKTGDMGQHYIYDGDDPVLTLNNNLEKKTATWYYQPLGLPLLQEDSQQARFFHGNHVGSTLFESNRQGEILSNYMYGSFGDHSNGAQQAEIGFTGRPFDSATKLVSFKFRDYDPMAGRFLQKDPLGVMSPWQSPYIYASNNPINYIDLYGLWTISQWVGGLAVGAAAIGAVMAAPAVIAAVGTLGVVGAVTTAATTAGTAIATASTATLTIGAGAIAGGAASGWLAATQGKGFFGSIGDTVIGATAGAGATIASGYGFAAGIAGSAVAGGFGASLTGGNWKRGAVFGAGGGLIGGILGGAFVEKIAGGLGTFMNAPTIEKIVSTVGGTLIGTGVGLGTGGIDAALGVGDTKRQTRQEKIDAALKPYGNNQSSCKKN